MELGKLKVSWQEKKIDRHSKHKVSYLNVASAFDIETTSTIVDGEPVSFMYAWCFGIGNKKHLARGRTWEEFVSLLDELRSYYGLNLNKRLVVYVQNLSFEFQFMKEYLNIVDQFSTDQREVMTAVTDMGIEFRDSYILSGTNLNDMANSLTNHKIEKLYGYLDYNIIRHHKTTLTAEEWKYIEHDVLILIYYIQEQIELYDNKITNLPKTNTGRVRTLINKNLKTSIGSGQKSYGAKERAFEAISNLRLTTTSYYSAKNAFTGGYVHSNPKYMNETLENVYSYDISSSYPSVLVYKKYPMSTPEKYRGLTLDEFKEITKDNLTIGDFAFKNLRKKTNVPDSYLSEEHCKISGLKIIDNGRVKRANKIAVTITNIDFNTVERVYEWDKLVIGETYVYKKDYLPLQIRQTVLNLYKDKTNLKGVKGKEKEYLNSKAMINSVYGMMVTDIIKPKHAYDNGTWVKQNRSHIEQIDEYNEKDERSNYYPWGVFIASYARENLWRAILAVGDDYVYSDTDSVKFTNLDKHIDYFNNYNALINKVADYMGNSKYLSIDMFKPKDKKGNTHTLGLWEVDGEYKRFKTLGAKMYVAETKDDELEFTVSGIGKEKIKKYMLDKYKDNDTVFNEFRSGLVIPKDYSGKTVSLYIDKPKEIEVTDYQGNKETVTALSGVYIAPTEFTIQHSINERNENIANEWENMNFFDLLDKSLKEYQKDLNNLRTRKIY